ncbi:MAG: FkbM family methyltransferase [Candidatus Paceibacterota bacterium]|jgi:FkbM family methyltransferase
MQPTLETLQTRYGRFTIDRERDKKMAKALAGDDYPNEKLLAVARAFVCAKDTVVDIGAHIGTFAVPAAKLAESVIAFEPSVSAAELLTRNAHDNAVSLSIIQKALGRKAGSGTLLVRNAANAGANTLVAGGDIPVTTLDTEVAHADFIKIDVEGMELEVLEGGAALIERAHPTVFFEVNLSQLRAHGASPRALERFFVKRGYRLYIPLPRRGGVLAHVRSATLLTACIAPRAWFLFGESAPFDLVAVPKGRELPLPYAGFAAALTDAVAHNLSVKVHRIRAFLHTLYEH